MGRKLALVIGNSEYDDGSLARLITPSEDVTDLASLLNSPNIGGFDEVRTLVNEAATNVRKAIARLFKEKSPDDLLLLYFSGHGVLDDQGHLYLAVKDTERDLLSGTAIPASFITGEMDRSRSKRQVLIFDCCHSGAFARGSKGVVGASVGTASAFEGTGYGRVVLTATDATQYAWEGDQVIGQADNSVFTHFMIQGLQTGEADQDQDGRITLDELYDYVYAQVVAKTPRQTPGKWSYKRQGEMVIAKNPRPIAPVNPLPPEVIESLNDPRPWVREGVVNELDRLADNAAPAIQQAALAALQHLAEDDSRKVAAHAQAALDRRQGVAKPIEPPSPVVLYSAAQPVAQVAPQAPSQAAPSVAAQPTTDDIPSKATVMPQPNANAAPIQTQKPATPVLLTTTPANQKRLALQVGLIISIGWFAGWAAGIFVGGLLNEAGTGAISLVLGWLSAGIVTGLAVKRITHTTREPLAWLGVGWPIWLALSFYQGSAVLIWLAIVATWFIASLAALRSVRNRIWMIAVLTAAAAGIAWPIVGSAWNLAAVKFFGAAYYWPMPYLLSAESYTAVDMLLGPAITAAVAGSILTFLLYRRAEPVEPT
jgi:hypothetical protein